MNRVVLVTGASGFVGRAVLRQAGVFEKLTMVPLVRDRAAAQVLDARQTYYGAQISLLNLSWPSMSQYSASADKESDIDNEWKSYERWMSSLVDAAAQTNIRFFQVGSGIEPYAMTDPPLITDPYLSYAYRKEALWQKVNATLPETSWRLRLHFLFGVGELSHRVVPAAIRACLTGEPLTVGAPERRRSWLDIDDAARGLLAAVIHPRPENWDICGTVPVSFAELLAMISGATGREAHIEASKLAVADAACLLVEPENPAQFIPQGVGDPDDLRLRLIDYARVLGN